MHPVPDLACDCHAHVFGPLDRFAFIPERDYTPPERLAADYRAMLKRLGVGRGVIVQPSVYGTDNGATLNALADLGDDFRGVTVVAPDTSDATFADLSARGVVGVRLSDLTKGGVPLRHLEAMADAISGSGWHIQIFAKFADQPELAARIRRLGVPVVIDHLGMIDPARGTADPAFAALVDLLRDGLCWLKLSGPYLSSRQPAPWPDVDAVAGGFVAACPQRLVWATDWPHPAAGDNPPDDALLIAALERWAPDPAVRKAILVDNPATLYGFAAP